MKAGQGKPGRLTKRLTGVRQGKAHDACRRRQVLGKAIKAGKAVGKRQRQKDDDDDGWRKGDGWLAGAGVWLAGWSGWLALAWLAAVVWAWAAWADKAEGKAAG